jgi:hypothetical protein
MTHTRLFTFGSFRRAIAQAGFDILEMKGVPAPFPLALGDNPFSRFLMKVNRMFISIGRGLFAYQIFVRMRPQPSLEYLLKAAGDHSERRVKEIERLSIGLPW